MGRNLCNWRQMWQGVTKFFSQNMYLSNSTPATIILFLEYTLYSYNEMKYGPGLQWYNSKDPKLLIGFTATRDECCSGLERYSIKSSLEKWFQYIQYSKHGVRYIFVSPPFWGDGLLPYKESQTQLRGKKREEEFHSWSVIILFLYCKKWPLDFEPNKEPDWHWT